MIHNLWRCFETTGAIDTYLSFKEYENHRNQYINGIDVEERLDDAEIDRASDT